MYFEPIGDEIGICDSCGHDEFKIMRRNGGTIYICASCDKSTQANTLKS